MRVFVSVARHAVAPDFWLLSLLSFFSFFILNEKSFRFRVVVDASPATFSSRRPLSRSRNAKETIATVTRATINRALALEVEDRRAMKVQISFHNESGVRGGIRRFFFFAFFEQLCDESLRKKKKKYARS